MSEPSESRTHDLVLFGATGFVGRLTAEYLLEAVPEGTAVALAGRSRDKLERLKADLGPGAAGWVLIEADSCDRSALDEMARSTKVVATTVGPYLKYGMPLVEACAEAGTHYADLTGETLFMRRSIDVAHERAEATGARIVHTCGFDSIPSDIGVLLLHEYAAANDLGDLGETSLVVRKMRGGASGGTIDSARASIDEGKADKAARKVMLDPYALSPDRSSEPKGTDERDPRGVIHEPELGGYLAPFVMGTVNTRVVRRSNALLDHAYGSALRYRELMLTGSGPMGAAKAAGVVGTLGALFGGLALSPTRKLLDRLLPDPGEGPDAEARERGFFTIDIHAETSAGPELVCAIHADGDPGYKATAVMLGEAALALALDGDRLPDRAGVLTPATGIGVRLAERLREAGHSYEVERR
ncbi:MAG TPA: saccharopine dehydrogenase NADP-binding domain-containing protein [Solirubrobacterales bacterium]|nr:saccharopine dehydrogenase NADP-binding domain-containing protein [Solirubrobacterales bacterium]